MAGHLELVVEFQFSVGEVLISPSLFPFLQVDSKLRLHYYVSKYKIVMDGVTHLKELSI